MLKQQNVTEIQISDLRNSTKYLRNNFWNGSIFSSTYYLKQNESCIILRAATNTNVKTIIKF